MNFFWKKANHISKACLIGLILILISVGTGLSAFAKPIQVAIVPFKVNAEKDLSFLKDGIVDMLTSRLFWEGKISIINRQAVEKASANIGGPLNETKARNLGTGLGADYVLFGSLTVFGNSVSIDAKMVDVSGKKQILTFFNQSQGMDQVIPSINQFASDINEKEFGRRIKTGQATSTVRPTSGQTGPSQVDTRTHPDKLMAGGMVEGDLSEGQGMAPGSAFIPTQGFQGKSVQFWKSQNFPFLINGIAVGDIDNDGKNETLMLLDDKLQIYRMTNHRLLKINEIAKTGSDHYIAIDIGDINNNGTPEIFVSSLNALRNSCSSFVLEYDGGQYKTIIDKAPWYYRIVHLPGHKPHLFGQKHKAETEDVSDADIFELVWEDSGYNRMQRILPRRRANVLGISYGDIMGTNEPNVVAYDSSDRIQIVDPKGEVRWKSGEHYGGTTQYFIPPKTDPGSGEIRKYYPMRLLMTDLDNDGKYELMVAKNYDVAGNLLKQFRHYTNAHFELMSWDGLGLASKWKTRKLSGAIRDFAIADFDNDGQMELVAVIVIKEGNTAFTKAKSTIIAYDLKSK